MAAITQPLTILARPRSCQLKADLLLSSLSSAAKAAIMMVHDIQVLNNRRYMCIPACHASPVTRAFYDWLRLKINRMATCALMSEWCPGAAAVIDRVYVCFRGKAALRSG